MSASQTPFEIPLVDKLSIRVVVDSFYERFLPKMEHGSVKIEQAGRLPGRQMTSLAGEWGLLRLYYMPKGNRTRQRLLWMVFLTRFSNNSSL